MVEKQKKMNARKTFAIGIDLGATTMKAGIVEKNGNIPDQLSADSKANRGPAVVIQQMIFVIQELLGRRKIAECSGIGIGAPGVISLTDGTVQHPPNFADWTKVDVGKQIRKAFKLPVFVENDANCAAMAEARYGAGIEFKDFLFVIWGTGVGGGIILDRKIYRGPYGGAGEIGHISIDYNGHRCNCGNFGCIESYIGQRYLSQRTKEIILSLPKDGTSSKIELLVNGKLDKINPAIISEAAEEGDAIAITVLEEAGSLLGCALSSIMNVLDLRVVVIGGGVSAAPAFVYKAIIANIRERILKPHREGVRVIRSKLENNAGIVGAASLVL